MEMPTQFEWDAAKEAANIAKHGISFAEATAVFTDAHAVDLDVSRATDGEVRRKVIGMIDGRLFAVVYTLRAAALRLISARATNRSEDREYGRR